MAQATTLKLTETKTCSTCPNFNNFQEPIGIADSTAFGSRNAPAFGRGWCNLFNHQARTYHQQTNDCVISSDIPISHDLADNLALFPDIDLDEEIEDELDKPYSEYTIGSIVKVIDPDEDHNEWAVFEIIDRKHNKHLYRSTDSYLNEAEWYFRLASNENIPTTISSSLWVREDEICFSHMSWNICTREIF